MKKNILYGLLVGLAASCFASAMWLTHVLDNWEFKTWDMRVRRFAQPSEATSKIKIILLDQASLDWGEKESGLSWPWPREVYAPLVNFCHRGGAASVSFDVLYTEPSVYGVGDDETFASAIEAAKPFVAAVFLGEKSGQDTSWPDGLKKPGISVEGLDAWLNSAKAEEVVRTRAAFPVPELAGAATMLGNVSEVPDSDGIIRRASVFKVFDGHVVPSLGCAPFVFDGKERANNWSIKDGALTMNNRALPIDESGSAILRYRGVSGTHEKFTAAEIIRSELRILDNEQPKIDPARLKGCHVFFGFSAPGLLDLRSTPLNSVTPGVEVHATLLDNLLTWDAFREASKGSVLIVLFGLAMLAGVVTTCTRKAWQSVIAFIVFLPLPALLGFLLYQQGIWWPIVALQMAVALSLIGSVVVNYATEGRQKAFIKNAFKHYVSADVVEELVKDPKRLQLGGEKRELTLYFSDLEKFSSFSEKLEPQQLTSFLNIYLTDMTNIIKEEGGTLDKYVGDAVVAFWNAPLAQEDHAVLACRAAIRCQRKLDERREALRQEYGATLKARIGLNTGDVVVGNMGSIDRFNYTVLGDAANLASRLEGANKHFGSFLLVSESTWKQAAGQVVGRELGRLRVVGREAPVRVYEVTGLAGDTVPAQFEAFEKGLALCYEGQWAEALACFEKMIDDPASQRYASKCRALIEDKSASWDGVWSLTEK